MLTFNKKQHRKNKYFSAVSPQSSIIQNPFNLKTSLTSASLKVLNVLLSYANVHRYVYPSCQTLARKTGLAIRTVNRALEQLRTLGLVHTVYMHRCSSTYYLAEWFWNMQVRNRLKYILDACKYIPFIWLFDGFFHPSGKMLQQRNVAPLYNKEYKYIKNSNNLSVQRQPTKQLSYARAHEENLVADGDHRCDSFLTKKGKKMTYEQIKLDLKEMCVPESDIVLLCHYPLKSVVYAINSLKGKAKTIDKPGRYLLGIVKNYQAQQEGKKVTEYFKKPTASFAPQPEVSLSNKKAAYPAYKHEERVIDHEAEAKNLAARKHEFPSIIALEKKLGCELTWDEVSANPLKYLAEIARIQTKTVQI